MYTRLIRSIGNEYVCRLLYDRVYIYIYRVCSWDLWESVYIFRKYVFFKKYLVSKIIIMLKITDRETFR